MNNVVKTKLCWSSKNKDLHAFNALCLSVFIFSGFLWPSLCLSESTLCNVCVCVLMLVSEDLYKKWKCTQFPFPLHQSVTDS